MDVLLRNGKELRTLTRFTIILAITFIWCSSFQNTALAHGGEPDSHRTIWEAWNWDPLLWIGIVLPGWLYLAGVRSLWKKSGSERVISRWHAAAFGAGWIALVAALISPLEALSGMLLSAHMVQHLLLMIVAAPFLLLGAPQMVLPWAFPLSWRIQTARCWNKQAGLRASWKFIANPFVVWWLHALAVWVWHLPGPYQAAVDNNMIHAIEHASFFISALLFWWVVIAGEKHGQMNYGLGTLYIFITALSSGVLGALITFAAEPWYPVYIDRTLQWGLTALEDQQLAGLIMWIPANFVYLVAVIVLLVEWFKQMDAKSAKEHSTPVPRRHM